MEIQPSSTPALLLQAKGLEQAREAVEEAQAAQRPTPDVIVELSQAARALGPTSGS